MKQKLTSRKFWAAVAAAAGALAIAIFGDSVDAATLTAVSSAVKVLIAYICGETAVDISRQFASILLPGDEE